MPVIETESFETRKVFREMGRPKTIGVSSLSIFITDGVWVGVAPPQTVRSTHW